MGSRHLQAYIQANLDGSISAYKSLVIIYASAFPCVTRAQLGMGERAVETVARVVPCVTSFESLSTQEKPTKKSGSEKASVARRNKEKTSQHAHLSLQ